MFTANIKRSFSVAEEHDTMMNKSAVIALARIKDMHAQVDYDECARPIADTKTIMHVNNVLKVTHGVLVLKLKLR